MKSKTIIQVWGQQDQGKSATIQLIREELIRFYLNPGYTYTFPLPKAEITDTIRINTFLIGIESCGDDLNYYNLNQRLDDFINITGVDILICASRIRNNVDQHLRNLANANGYRILKVTNYRTDNPMFNQHDLNLLAARHIIDIVDNIINGIL